MEEDEVEGERERMGGKFTIATRRGKSPLVI